MFPDRGFKADPEFLFWKYRPGFIRQRESNLIIAAIEGRVIGQIGIMNFKCMWNGQETECHWICDLMIDTEYRGNKITYKLYDLAVQQSEITIGQNPTPAAWYSMHKYGFEYIPGPRVAILPLNGTYFSGVYSLGNSIIKIILHPFFRINAQYQLNQILKNNKSDGRVVECNPVSLVEQLDRCPRLTSRIIHDKEFFRWRNSYPIHYKRKICGLRINQSFLIYMRNGSRIIIMDYRIDTKEEGNKLIKSCISKYVSEEINRIESYLYPYYDGLSLVDLGFVPFGKPINIIYFSSTNDKEIPTYYHYTQYDGDGGL